MLVCTCGFRTSMNCWVSIEQNQLRLEYSFRLPKEGTDILCLLGKISNLSSTCVSASIYHHCRIYIYTSVNICNEYTSSTFIYSIYKV